MSQYLARRHHHLRTGALAKVADDRCLDVDRWPGHVGAPTHSHGPTREQILGNVFPRTDISITRDVFVDVKDPRPPYPSRYTATTTWKRAAPASTPMSRTKPTWREKLLDSKGH